MIGTNIGRMFSLFSRTITSAFIIIVNNIKMWTDLSITSNKLMMSGFIKEIHMQRYQTRMTSSDSNICSASSFYSLNVSLPVADGVVFSRRICCWHATAHHCVSPAALSPSPRYPPSFASWLTCVHSETAPPATNSNTLYTHVAINDPHDLASNWSLHMRVPVLLQPRQLCCLVLCPALAIMINALWPEKGITPVSKQCPRFRSLNQHWKDINPILLSQIDV